VNDLHLPQSASPRPDPHGGRLIKKPSRDSISPNKVPDSPSKVLIPFDLFDLEFLVCLPLFLLTLPVFDDTKLVTGYQPILGDSPDL
jgi:hypothetical protein